MSETNAIAGIAASIPIANLDTDQIMPKQFLRGIDKRGLDKGLLWDLRFDAQGRARPDFVLNVPAFADARMLVCGPNFGCGSSRGHAVWGLQQYGIQAVVAPSFGEIFYSNAMNNRLLAVMLPPADVQSLMAECSAAWPCRITIDVAAGTLHSPRQTFGFTLSARHRQMFIEGLDSIGASLEHRTEIAAFAQRHWAAQPWLKDVARRTRQRLMLPACPAPSPRSGVDARAAAS